METIGKYLKKERELRNISLREVANNTRVREHLLRAMEEDRYDLLPAPTYVRGFFFSYAKYLGLDPKDILVRYERLLEGGSVIRPEVQSEKKISWDIKYLWVIGGAIGVCFIVSYLLFLHPPESAIQPTPEKPAVGETTSFPRIAEAPVVQEKKPFTLQLKAVEETWVSIRVNGEPEKEITLKPGEGASYRASSRIQLIVGNAGGIDLVFNGEPLERLGKSGEVVAPVFTPQGMEMRRYEKPRSP
jgi:transcriptional regulator with XRE-family HTH domain